MDKVEELKQKAKIPKNTLLALLSVVGKDESAIDMERDKKYRFTESELDEYAQQVSREKDEKILTLVKQKRALEDMLVEKNKAIRIDQSRAS